MKLSNENRIAFVESFAYYKNKKEVVTIKDFGKTKKTKIISKQQKTSHLQKVNK